MSSSTEPSATPTGSRLRMVLVLLPLALLLALAALFALSLQRNDPSVLPSALVGKPLPDFDLTALEGLRDLDGNAIGGFASGDLADGQPSIINIWASWCGPCRVEHPLLMALTRQNGVRMVGINYKDKSAPALQFLRSLGNPYDRVGVDDTGRVAIEFGLTGVPETFIVNGKGEIVHKHVGPLTPEDMLAQARFMRVLATVSGSS